MQRDKRNSFEVKRKFLTLLLLLASLPMMADFISYNECVWNQSAPRVEITEKSGYMTQVSATERYSLGISIYANNSPIWVNYKHVYKASVFDQVTGWSKFLDRNQQEIDPQTNPANESSIIPDWM